VKPLLKDECLSRITVHMRISALLEENVARAKECESMALALARDLADRRSEGNEGADVWLFVDAMRDGFVVVDVVSDKIVFSNPAFERQVGFSRKELRGLGVRDLDVSWGEAFWREHLEALRRDTRGLTLVRDLVTKNGSCVRAEISTCLIEQNGNARIVATVRALSGGATR
jgi:PAS domain S-box-containing protein